jgi:hypothetical protein
MPLIHFKQPSKFLDIVDKIPSGILFRTAMAEYIVKVGHNNKAEQCLQCRVYRTSLVEEHDLFSSKLMFCMSR